MKADFDTRLQACALRLLGHRASPVPAKLFAQAHNLARAWRIRYYA
ncbi:MAG TPA: hypothetical protein VF553_08995 [Pyrinomonadaceae bacterium]|jgi:hypothetical protein